MVVEQIFGSACDDHPRDTSGSIRPARLGDLRPRPAGGARRARRAGLDRRKARSSSTRRRARVTQIESLVVQASLLAAGSLDPGRRARARAAPGAGEALPRRRRPPRARRDRGRCCRPRCGRSSDSDVAARTDSPAASLAAARSRQAILDAARQLRNDPRASACWRRCARADRSASSRTPACAHEPSRRMVELAEDASTRRRAPSDGRSRARSAVVVRSVSGCQKMLTAVRQISGGGSPGADAPTHWTRSGSAAASQPCSRRHRREPRKRPPSKSGRGHEVPRVGCAPPALPRGLVHRARGRGEAEADARLRVAVPDGRGLRRALARLGLGLDRYHRQAQGDDIDIDAVIEARVELLAGSAPDEAVFIDSVRRRRDLSVLLLLDISGSAGEPAATGRTVHEQQRAAAAALTLALHELGDRVALYAYHSQGRSAVQLMPVKRFGDDLDALVMRRLDGLEPGAYSRLGAAIRHGTAVLRGRRAGRRAGCSSCCPTGWPTTTATSPRTARPTRGARSPRRAVRAVGCLCLSIGASTDDETLRRVFGTAAHAALPAPEQLSRGIGPLFRSALRSAEVRRRVRCRATRERRHRRRRVTTAAAILRAGRRTKSASSRPPSGKGCRS